MGYIENLRKLVGHECVILNGSAVVIVNEKGELLLQQRAYPDGRWCFPCGLMELGESTVQTAKREVLEETNLIIEDLELLGVYSGENHLCKAANGDEWYVVTTAYVTNTYSGELRINDYESAALQWFNVDHIPQNFAKSHLLILNDYKNRFLSKD